MYHSSADHNPLSTISSFPHCVPSYLEDSSQRLLPTAVPLCNHRSWDPLLLLLATPQNKSMSQHLPILLILHLLWNLNLKWTVQRMRKCRGSQMIPAIMRAYRSQSCDTVTLTALPAAWSAKLHFLSL